MRIIRRKVCLMLVGLSAHASVPKAGRQRVTLHSYGDDKAFFMAFLSTRSLGAIRCII